MPSKTWTNRVLGIESVEALFIQPGGSPIHHDPEVVVLEQFGDFHDSLAAQHFNARVSQPGRYQANGAIVAYAEKNSRREKYLCPALPCLQHLVRLQLNRSNGVRCDCLSGYGHLSFHVIQRSWDSAAGRGCRYRQRIVAASTPSNVL